MRASKSSGSELLGKLSEGSRIFVEEVSTKCARIQQPFAGWVALEKTAGPVLHQDPWHRCEPGQKAASVRVVDSVLERLRAGAPASSAVASSRDAASERNAELQPVMFQENSAAPDSAGSDSRILPTSSTRLDSSGGPDAAAASADDDIRILLTSSVQPDSSQGPDAASGAVEAVQDDIGVLPETPQLGSSAGLEQGSPGSAEDSGPDAASASAGGDFRILPADAWRQLHTGFQLDRGEGAAVASASTSWKVTPGSCRQVPPSLTAVGAQMPRQLQRMTTSA